MEMKQCFTHKLSPKILMIKVFNMVKILFLRMALSGFLNLVERLDYEQWSAIMETGFGGILTKYDPWDTSWSLSNGKALIYEEDVHVTLGLPMRPHKISEGKSSETDIEFLEQWRKRWNIKRGGPLNGSMDDVILEHGGHGPKFIIDFIISAISTCIVANANGTCHFRNANEIHNYNWCAYVIKCLNDAVIEWKGDKSKFFTSPLLFLMVSAFYHPISLMFTQILYIIFLMKITNFNIYNVLLCKLFYLDRVEFRANKVERWFPIAINWQTEKMRKRDRDKQLLREYERVRIIENIAYQNVACLAEADLKVYLKESGELSTKTTAREQQCPHCSHCNRQFQDPIPFHNDPVQNETDCLSPDDTYYYSPEFMEQVKQLESMAREKNAAEKGDGFQSSNLGISPEKGRCASRSVDITPATSKFGFSSKGAANASIPGISYQHTYRATENPVNFGKSHEARNIAQGRQRKTRT
ncbi:LOW QUALITY PROTEIN: hypothetical protein Cgig2_018562 [Carnegiea gigantea]|uniref:Uncharacterized protein n=1 Tax=Carnegiea gigantea TaxID=171969 RepID=A0A9Q1QL55_9CARY|nr:LOW QUALITY PROTEIN: hypothetical protein Cgig2_018562 [Carnegiea gigantea]